MVNRENTHLILKNNDIQKYCTEMQQAQLAAICETISDGRFADGKQLNMYYICNTDEPYSERVLRIIFEGEQIKKQVN